MAQYTLTTQNEEGESQHLTVHLEDEHADEEAETLHGLAEQAEQVPELREQLDETESELETVRELAVNEIVRKKKLAGEIGEDADFSEEDEVEYLEGLPPKRLKKEWDRAMHLDVETDSATENKTPDDGKPDPYKGAEK